MDPINRMLETNPIHFFLVARTVPFFHIYARHFKKKALLLTQFWIQNIYFAGLDSAYDEYLEAPALGVI